MRPKLFFLVGEVALTTTLAIVVGLYGDPMLWAFLVWLGFTKVYTAWYLKQQINQINSRLGFGVSVPIQEIPQVMDQIAKRLGPNKMTDWPTQADTPGTGFQCDLPATGVKQPLPRRHRRNLLDELTDLENETPPRG